MCKLLLNLVKEWLKTGPIKVQGLKLVFTKMGNKLKFEILYKIYKYKQCITICQICQNMCNIYHIISINSLVKVKQKIRYRDISKVIYCKCSPIGINRLLTGLYALPYSFKDNTVFNTLSSVTCNEKIFCKQPTGPRHLNPLVNKRVYNVY